MQNSKTATCYLQIKQHTRYPYEAVPVRVTGRKPQVLQQGCILVKIKVQIPKQAWQPFEAEALVDVPAELIQSEISVEAEDPQ